MTVRKDLPIKKLNILNTTGKIIAIVMFMLSSAICLSFCAHAQTYDFYAEAVDTLSKLGVISGYEDGSFGGADAVERWHMSLWIAKLETGKTSSDEYASIWGTEIDNTAFADIKSYQAMGAIGYAAKRGIIVGRSETVFDPAGGITYQEALTMAVRALGFGSPAMDAGYPLSYIEKAVQLGIDKNISGVLYTDKLNRSRSALILFNTLRIPDVHGKTYAADIFRLSVVVITGTSTHKTSETAPAIQPGYVSFNLIGENGLTDDLVTYKLPSAEFGITPADADSRLGASYTISSNDNFKSLNIVVANRSAVFDARQIGIQPGMLSLGEDSYKVVRRYSPGDNRNELLVYITNNINIEQINRFKSDNEYNILDKNGSIAAYYAPEITGSTVEPYINPHDSNRPLYGKAGIEAQGGELYEDIIFGYRQLVDTDTLEKYNRHASAIAYDDNADGLWDRLFYTYQEFCKLSYDPTGLKYNLNGSRNTVLRFIDGKTGKSVMSAPTGYIRYSYDPLSRQLALHETYMYKTGLVTAVNTAVPDIVIGGTRYTIGAGNFPGAEYDNTGADIGLIGKQVNYVLSGDAVIRIFDSATAEVFAVFDSLTGLTSSGYATGLAYIQSVTPSVITIATVNGQSYQTFAISGREDGVKPLTKGMLFSGTKDALGFWHLQTVSGYANAVSEYTVESPQIAKSATTEEPAASGDKITFKNNIAHMTFGDLNQFNTNEDTLFIVYNRGAGVIETARGIPADDSIIRVSDKIYVAYFGTGNGPTAQFVYIGDGAFENFAMVNREYWYDTVIYVDRNSKATAIPDEYDSGARNEWQYSRVLDMVNGRFITVNTTYDRQLRAGGFYTIKNGYVSGQVTVSADSEIKQGRLLETGMFYSTVVEDTRGTMETDSAYIYLYYLKDGNVAVSDMTGAPLKPESYGNGAYWYDGYLKGSRVILAF